jgi:hypothetical protein
MPILLALGDDMADGAKNHGAAIKLKQNDEVAIRGDLDPARAAFNALNSSRGALAQLNLDLRTADNAARVFIKAASAVLAQNLGEFWSAAWAPTGFPNQSTGVPPAQDDRFTLCKSLEKFFTDNPDYEVTTPKLVVTAARATAVYTALKTARDGVNDGNQDVGQKKVACDAAEAVLRTRMRGLITELTQLLDDNDPLWESFGLTRPASDHTPESPTALTLTAGAAGNVHANWATAPRADHYRAYQKVEGVDPDFVEVAGPIDPEYTFGSLPSGKTLNVEITAVNTAGESDPCAVVSIVVP